MSVYHEQLPYLFFQLDAESAQRVTGLQELMLQQCETDAQREFLSKRRIMPGDLKVVLALLPQSDPIEGDDDEVTMEKLKKNTYSLIAFYKLEEEATWKPKDLKLSFSNSVNFQIDVVGYNRHLVIPMLASTDSMEYHFKRMAYRMLKGSIIEYYPYCALFRNVFPARSAVDKPVPESILWRRLEPLQPLMLYLQHSTERAQHLDTFGLPCEKYEKCC